MMVPVEPLAGAADFGKDRPHEFLPAESWMDGHEKHKIEMMEVGFDAREGRFRIYRDTGPDTERPDGARGRRQSRSAGFDVDGQVIGAGFGEGFEVRERMRHHEMHVKRQASRLANFTDHRRADREVGDEVRVHDVNMDQIGAGFGHGADFGAEPREIGRKNRRRNPDGRRPALLGASQNGYVSSHIVTGPSFTIRTLIIAAKRPVWAGTPSDFRSATYCSYNRSARSGGAAPVNEGRWPFWVSA